MDYILGILIGYLLGSISFSYIIGRTVAKIDIREHGSGNAGATNTLRVLGKGPGIVVFILDIAKGAVAVLMTIVLFPNNDLAAVLAGFFSVLGHNWPLFSKFRGGKGVATTIGVMVVLSWLSAILSGVIAISFIFWKRYVSLGSLIFTALIPFWMIIFNKPLSYVLGAAFLAILVFIRHHENLLRLIQGKENKIGKKGSRKLS